MTSSNLTADCARCCALCCVAYAFERSLEFAAAKEAHSSCEHLDGGFRCSIHAERASVGYPGCVAYDCFGAGQHVTQTVFGGRAWTELAEPALMFEAFLVVHGLLEQVALLQTALRFDLPFSSRARLHERVAQLLSLVATDPEGLRNVELAWERGATNTLLQTLRPHVARARRALPVILDAPLDGKKAG